MIATTMSAITLNLTSLTLCLLPVLMFGKTLSDPLDSVHMIYHEFAAI